MNDLLQDTRFWLITLGTAVVGLVRYLWKKQERRLDLLEKESVRRAELDQLRADLREEHEQNSARLDRIEDGITGTHERLDHLYRDLIQR